MKWNKIAIAFTQVIMQPSAGNNCHSLPTENVIRLTAQR